MHECDIRVPGHGMTMPLWFGTTFCTKYRLHPTLSACWGLSLQLEGPAVAVG